MSKSKNKTAVLREEAKQFYLDQKNIESKWLKQYGSISIDNDYQRNRSCLTETFNMLDIIMDNCLDEFRQTHTILRIESNGRQLIYTFKSGSQEIMFAAPTSFALRVTALRAIGYPLSDELLYDTRLLRNETTHGNQTVILKHMELGPDVTRKAMLAIADALILLGKLNPILREPSFEWLRVRQGDTLFGGAYVIGPLIGEGGTSRVYRASQQRFDRTVAIKELKPEAYSKSLISHECETMLSLRHNQIPRIADTFYENGTYYIVMSFIDGMTLDKYVNCTSLPASRPNGTEIALSQDFEDSNSAAEELSDNQIPLSDKNRLAIACSLCDVIHYLHSPDVGIIFVDLTPNNIMIGKNNLAYLIDFGISVPSRTRQVLPAATPGYAAPEVFANGLLDERSDIYSFGYILRYLYTGLNPSEKADIPTSALISDKTIVSVINRCTARNPEERFQSINDVKQALSEKMPSRFWHQTHPILLGTACLAALIIFGITAYQYSDKAQPTDVTVLSNAEYTDHKMIWYDPVLEARMRALTGITDRDIMLSNVWALKELTLNGDTTISDSEAVESEQTSLPDSNKITDIRALSELTNLTYLNLSGNAISDASSLSCLKSLKTLFLDNNNLTDIRFLSDMPDLTDLSLSGNSIENITSVVNLKHLSSLYLSDNPIIFKPFEDELKSINPVYLTSLRVLDLNGCRMEDVSFLSSIASLEELYLGNNSIKDISPISGLTHLKALDLQDNPIGSRANSSLSSVLPHLSRLIRLDLENCELTDADLTNEDMTASFTAEGLLYLDLSGNHLTSIAPIESLSSLTWLDLGNNKLTGDLSDLKEMSHLYYLDVHSNQITDLSTIGQFTELKYLYVRDNSLTDYSAIESLDLEELD